MATTTPDGISYPDLLCRLISAMALTGRDAPDVGDLVRRGKSLFPEHTTELDSLLAAWQEMHGVATSPPPAPPAPDATSVGGTAAAVARNSGIAALGVCGTLLATNWDRIGPLLDTLRIPVRSTWSLLGFIALAGAVGAAVNAFWSHSASVLPQQPQVGGRSLFLPGFLLNVLAGALAAAVTIWLPTVTIDTPPGAEPAAGTVVASTTLLTPAFLASAFVAGFGASLTVTGQRDKNFLWLAVQNALLRPRDPAAAKQVANARSALEAFSAATGVAISGVTVSAPLAGASAAAQNDLLRDLNPDGVRSFLAAARRGDRPATLTRDATGLPMGVLRVVAGLDSPLREAVRDLPLTDVARSDLEVFQRGLTAAGVNVAAMKPTVESAWRAARAARDKLDHMPPDWRLSTDQLG